MTEKSPEAFRTISEVADDLDLPQHVLRFWETRFGQIRPLKRGGGRRYYRPEDVDLLRGIRHLLYDEGYTIKGVQRILKERGVRQVATGWREISREDQREPIGAEAASNPPEAELDEPAGEVFQPSAEADAEETGSAGLSPDMVHRLKSALFELTECKRILQEARRES